MVRTAHGKALISLLMAGALMLGTHAKASAPTHQPLAFRVTLADQERTVAAVQQAVMERLEEERRQEVARRQAEEAQRQAEEERRRQDARRMLSSRGQERSLVDYPVASPSYVSVEELDSAFAGTAMEGLGTAFVQAEQRFQVNAVILAAIAVHESAWGKSTYARERHNLFGFGAYTSAPDSAMRFNSKQEGIAAVAQWLQAQYLSEGGQYYRGGTLRAMSPIYAADESWAFKVATIATTISRRMAE